jgi:glucan phosphoethanolaminetransferase (alkaline phosphatase superfamily)
MYALKLPRFVGDNIEKYNKELTLFKEVQEKRKSGKITFKATKKGQGETYIVVIGESLNKTHMGLYGYKRETTPILSKMYQNHEILRFDNIYSNHTHTMQVLSLALTEANQYNKKDYYNSLSIVDILNQADIETYWLSNQNMLGGWDNLVSVIAHSANHITSINTSIGYTITAQKYDGELIPKVTKILSQKSRKNRVIFVHLMGSHSTYWTRYPQDNYKIYRNNQGNQVDDYDNSILYNDYVVSSILKELQKQKGISGFIYMPDHADDIDHNLGHGSAHFTIEMTQIPMIMWFSNAYQKLYQNKYQTLSKNSNRLYSNDLFHDTLIGIFNIKTERYSRQYDLSSNHYQLKEESALVLHGKRHYKGKKTSPLP